MTDRIRFFAHQDEQTLLIERSNCSPLRSEEFFGWFPKL